MHPTLFEFHLGSFTIPLHTYGLMIAIGYLVGNAVVRWLSKKSNVNPDLSSDLSLGLLMSGIVGARILFVITRFDYFVQNPLEIVAIWSGGLVFFGGLIAATGYAIWFFRKHKLSAWNMIDVLSPGLVVAHAFGRIGCLGAGCCYGRPTDVAWGIRLNSELVDPLLRNVTLHPTQIYESVSLFILFAGLMWIFKNRKFQGQVGLSYFMAYPIIRSIIEEFRGDSVRGFVIENVLSTSQFISFLVFIAALGVLQWRLKNLSKKHA